MNRIAILARIMITDCNVRLAYQLNQLYNSIEEEKLSKINTQFAKYSKIRFWRNKDGRAKQQPK